MTKEKLDLKMGTPDEAFWTNTLKKAREEQYQYKKLIEINNLIIDYAKENIKKEKENWGHAEEKLK